MSENLISRIMRHEGFTATAIIDVSPNYEIGYGHDITPSQLADYSNGITQQEAYQLLLVDIQNCKNLANKHFTWILGMDDVRADVIYEMCYQIGVGGVSGFPRMIAAIRIGDFGNAAKEMLNSQWHSQTPDRCEELANIMLTGQA